MRWRSSGISACLSRPACCASSSALSAASAAKGESGSIGFSRRSGRGGVRRAWPVGMAVAGDPACSGAGRVRAGACPLAAAGAAGGFAVGGGCGRRRLRPRRARPRLAAVAALAAWLPPRPVTVRRGRPPDLDEGRFGRRRCGAVAAPTAPLASRLATAPPAASLPSVRRSACLGRLVGRIRRLAEPPLRRRFGHPRDSRHGGRPASCWLSFEREALRRSLGHVRASARRRGRRRRRRRRRRRLPAAIGGVSGATAVAAGSPRLPVGGAGRRSQR